jgi:hypothetical protein
VFVTSIAQEKLQARRDKIVQVLRLRSEMGALIEIAPDRTPDGSSSSSAADHRAPRHVDEIDALAREETVSTAVVPRASRPRALNRKLAAMALGLAVSLGIAAFVTLRWNESSPSAALTDDRSPSGPGPIVTATPAPSVSGMALPDGSSAVASPAEAASAVVVSTPSSAAPVPFKRGGSLPASPSAKPHTTQPPAPLASSPYSVKR